jgi:hypothetical protein
MNVDPPTKPAMVYREVLKQFSDHGLPAFDLQQWWDRPNLLLGDDSPGRVASTDPLAVLLAAAAYASASGRDDVASWAGVGRVTAIRIELEHLPPTSYYDGQVLRLPAGDGRIREGTVLAVFETSIDVHFGGAVVAF